MKLRAIASAAVIVLAFTTIALGAMLSQMRGVVLDPKGDPVKDAKVALRSLTSDYLRTERTGDNGEFIFAGVTSGEYSLAVEAVGFAKSEQSVTVVSGSSPEVRFQACEQRANSEHAGGHPHGKRESYN